MGFQTPLPDKNESRESYKKRLDMHTKFIKENSIWLKLFNLSKKRKK